MSYAASDENVIEGCRRIVAFLEELKKNKGINVEPHNRAIVRFFSVDFSAGGPANIFAFSYFCFLLRREPVSTQVRLTYRVFLRLGRLPRM